MNNSLPHQDNPDNLFSTLSQITVIDATTNQINAEETNSMRRFWGVVKTWTDQNPAPSNHINPKKDEKALELSFGQSLEEQGISVQYQVKCDAGIADIVTPDAIYEIKDTLDENSFFKALGQISVYRQQINPAAKAFIVGRIEAMSLKRRNAMISSAQALGIEVIFWNN